MKLVSAHVTNYRSVLDSGEFGIDGTARHGDAFDRFEALFKALIGLLK